MSPLTKGRILIVEDEPGFRRIYRDFLEKEGYFILEADEGEKGLEMIRTEKPDLILLDIVLPKLTGFDILKQIRADDATKQIPVIIFSVLGEKETIKKGLELGANDFAVKGFYSPGEMLSKIRSLLFKADMRKHLVSYKISVHENQADAIKLQEDMGLMKSFGCPHCENELVMELIPDFSRTDGHWFFTHFICPECRRTY
ncbi:MAG: response regulator [Candidatus Omnitrophica bacterium]|nr:response regulator [Candidatus Omnitrophota bacterium]